MLGAATAFLQATAARSGMFTKDEYDKKSRRSVVRGAARRSGARRQVCGAEAAGGVAGWRRGGYRAYADQLADAMSGAMQ